MQLILCHHGVNNVRLAFLINDLYALLGWLSLSNQVSNEPAVPPCSADCHIEILWFFVGKLVKICRAVVKHLLQPILQILVS